jgi:gas vesicle protein
LREEALKDCRNSLINWNQVEDDLRKFREEDMPDFEKWHKDTIQPLKDQLKPYEEKFFPLRDLVVEIIDYARFHGISESLAYQKILKRKKNPENAGFDPFYDDEEILEEEFEGEFQEKFKKARESWKNESLGDDQEEVNSPPPENLNQSIPSSVELGLRAKEKYRAIARILRPDLKNSLSPRDLELWMNAQTAWKTKNIEVLDRILLVLKIREGKELDGISLSDLRTARKVFENFAKTVKKEIRVVKKNFEWRFSQRTQKEKSKFVKKVEKDISKEISEIKSHIRELEAFLDSIRRTPLLPPRRRFS